MLSVITEEMADRRISCVIVEGFHCFHDSSVVDLLDLHIWLEKDFLVVRKRRQKLNPKWTDSYCQHELWPQHFEYKDQVFSRIPNRLFMFSGEPQPKESPEPTQEIIVLIRSSAENMSAFDQERAKAAQRLQLAIDIAITDSMVLPSTTKA